MVLGRDYKLIEQSPVFREGESIQVSVEFLQKYDTNLHHNYTGKFFIVNAPVFNMVGMGMKFSSCRQRWSAIK